jgi:putative membrane protein
MTIGRLCWRRRAGGHDSEHLNLSAEAVRQAMRGTGCAAPAPDPFHYPFHSEEGPMIDLLKHGLCSAALVAAIAVAGCDNNDTASNTGTAGTGTGTASDDTRTAGDVARDTGDAAQRGVDDAQTAAARSGAAATQPAGGLIGERVSSAGEKQFILAAASAGAFEVKSSQLAQEKAANDDSTKKFADRMIAEHEDNNDELKRIATRMNINVPSDLQPQHQQLLDQLNQAPTDQFAKKYHDIQRQAHEQTVRLFQQAQNTVQTPELKEYVTKTLPVLQAHLQDLQGHQH